jgi:hypothetical protein
MCLRDVGKSLKRLMAAGYVLRESEGKQRGVYRVSDVREFKGAFKLQSQCVFCKQAINTLVCPNCAGREDLEDAV